MKNLLKEFLNINTKPQRLDILMKEILNQKFNTDRKSHYEKILEKEYNVTRTKSKPEKTFSLSRSAILVVGIVGLVALALGYQKLGVDNHDDKVHRYLATNIIKYQETTRSNDIQNDLRSSAYVSFNAGEYETFLDQMSTQSNLSSEDQFFSAYAKLRLGDYNSALTDFEVLRSKLTKGDQYYEEMELYQTICVLLLDKDYFRAKFDEMSEKSYAKKEIQKILND